MNWIIPGTVLEIRREDAENVEALFSSMFLGGNIALGQVANITGLEPYTVQNWVKRGFLSPPQQKRYTMRQLCRIIHINMLKNALSLESICGLLSYINGSLDNEADDLIDDSQLFFLFVKLAARARQLGDPSAWDQALDQALLNYSEPIPGARDRVEKALRIMLTAWIASRMRTNAEQMLGQLSE